MQPQLERVCATRVGEFIHRRLERQVALCVAGGAHRSGARMLSRGEQTRRLAGLLRGGVGRLDSDLGGRPAARDVAALLDGAGAVIWWTRQAGGPHRDSFPLCSRCSLPPVLAADSGCLGSRWRAVPGGFGSRGLRSEQVRASGLYGAIVTAGGPRPRRLTGL